MPHARYQNLGLRLSLRHLWTGLGIDVVATAWSRAQHPERSDGMASYFAIECMRAGSFEKRQGRRRLLADPGLAVFFNPDEPYEVRHPVGQSNAGTTLRIDPSLLPERVRERGFRRAAAPLPAALLLDLQRLGARLEAQAAHPAAPTAARMAAFTTELALEEELLSVVQRAVALDDAGGSESSSTESDACGARGALGAPSAEAERRARCVREFLNASFAQPLRLADVARAADCSVWHVAKQFRRATGSTIHAELLRLRLRHALEALRGGADDLTRLALELGFSSHSHFTAAFRAEFGLAPREARRLLRSRAVSLERVARRARPLPRA